MQMMVLVSQFEKLFQLSAPLMTKVGKMNLGLVGSVNMYVVNVRSNVITLRKYIFKKHVIVKNLL